MPQERAAIEPAQIVARRRTRGGRRTRCRRRAARCGARPRRRPRRRVAIGSATTRCRPTETTNRAGMRCVLGLGGGICRALRRRGRTGRRPCRDVSDHRCGRRQRDRCGPPRRPTRCRDDAGARPRALLERVVTGRGAIALCRRPSRSSARRENERVVGRVIPRRGDQAQCAAARRAAPPRCELARRRTSRASTSNARRRSPTRRRDPRRRPRSRPLLALDGALPEREVDEIVVVEIGRDRARESASRDARQDRHARPRAIRRARASPRAASCRAAPLRARARARRPPACVRPKRS